MIGQESALAPFLDFSAFTPSQSVVGTMMMSREANYDSLTCFYRVQGVDGSVLDEQGHLVRPGDAAYRSAALSARNRVDELSNLSIRDNQIRTSAITISEASLLAPCVQVNGHTFFYWGAANEDGLSHFQNLGNLTFGMEDTVGLGDRDFDDHVFGFVFSHVTTNPGFPQG